MDLKKTDICVISHGHYDHGGGIRSFLKINEKAPVYIRKDAFLPHFNREGKFIGLDKELFDDKRLIFTGDHCVLDEGYELFTCNRRKRDTDPVSSDLTELTKDGLAKDVFRHEQYLLIEEKGRKILFSGCSHKGILNILKWFSPDILIGGFHFHKIDDETKLAFYARELMKYDTVYYTCHCTGERQYDLLKKYTDERLNYLSCGECIEI